jgi:superfamily II DNA/RNA helicase
MPDPHLVDSKATFSAFSHILDARLLRALADLGFARPTLVQAKAIPLALEGRDILARARTGSGKTAAYCIPMVQKVLSANGVGAIYLQRFSSILTSAESNPPQAKTLVLSSWCPRVNCLNKCMLIYGHCFRTARMK